jgi:hypothetical protein
VISFENISPGAEPQLTSSDLIISCEEVEKVSELEFTKLATKHLRSKLLMDNLKTKYLGPYSQHFIFFVTYELTHRARVFNYSRLEMLVKEKYSSLF